MRHRLALMRMSAPGMAWSVALAFALCGPGVSQRSRILGTIFHARRSDSGCAVGLRYREIPGELLRPSPGPNAEFFADLMMM